MTNKPMAVLMLPLKISDIVEMLNEHSDLVLDYDVDYDSVVIRK